ncbi:hypothetical protein BGZ60DRAFT_570358 [Tricladium varicosporioides]|nr:hypothetical protein BGZ60DRAFT_570358 [Hymenoscyphus varicosporioides]
MNNNQFRKLVLDTPARQAQSSSSSDSKKNGPSATPALGSRMRNSIPMTPRSIAGYHPKNDFARQLLERQRESSSQSNPKKFKSSSAPKGAKLPEGYVDRTKQRENDDEDDNEKSQRINALEVAMKEGQIEFVTFVALKEEILREGVGGKDGEEKNLAKTKGLDWELLRRARAGEVDTLDVLENRSQKTANELDEEAEDVDDELDELEGKEVRAMVKEKVAKKGEMAPPELMGKKRNRDQLIAELKAARAAAKAAAQPSLGSKFKKVGEKRAESRIEKDKKGREVLITIDEDGNEKRKVRKIQAEPEVEKGHGLLMPDKDAKPLGMEVPEIPKPLEDDNEDINIFDDAGDDYDPLAGLEEDSSDEEKDDQEEGELSDEGKKTERETKNKTEALSMAPPPRPSQSRNYFGDSKPKPEPSNKPAALSDPTLLAALKKASSLNPILNPSASDAEQKAKEEKRRKMLQQDDRDAQDMDMGFGSSRFGDEEEMEGEGKKVKLSEWGKDGEDDGEGGKGEGKGKRKRGPKKRKGDVNSASDVLAAMERRKEKGRER